MAAEGHCGVELCQPFSSACGAQLRQRWGPGYCGSPAARPCGPTAQIVHEGPRCLGRRGRAAPRHHGGRPQRHTVWPDLLSQLGTVYCLQGCSHAKLPAFCLSCVADVFRYCHVRVPAGLLKDLLPRPVTLVLEHSQELSKDLNLFPSLIGIWIPDPAFKQDLAQVFGAPFALISANLSSQASSQNVFEFQNLWPQLSLVIDGGPTEDGQGPEYHLGSTTADLSVSGKFGIIHPPKEVWAAPLTGILLVNPGGREDPRTDAGHYVSVHW